MALTYLEPLGPPRPVVGDLYLYCNRYMTLTLGLLSSVRWMELTLGLLSESEI